MAAPRDRRHIVVPGEPRAEKYRRHGRNIEEKTYRPPDRTKHGRALTKALLAAQHKAESRRASLAIEVEGAQPGLYIQFESRSGRPLELGSLEDARQGIELVAYSRIEKADKAKGPVEQATVFVPDGKVKHFLERFAKYSGERESKQRHEKSIDPIRRLRLATLRAIWTDDLDSFPADRSVVWFEVWLRRQHRDGKVTAEPAARSRIASFADQAGMVLGDRELIFEDRTVVLLRGTAEQLSKSLDVIDDIAEVRLAKGSAEFFVEQENRDQRQWVDELLQRTTFASDDAPAVCVMDTGINRGHPLLSPVLAEGDCHACDPAWLVDDHDGHGTEMGGVALYGDLAAALESNGPVEVGHQLESVKILPPGNDNPPELYGSITAEGTGRVEVAAPRRNRCFAMAVTTGDGRDRGQPSSWSAAVDALAAGAFEGAGRARQRRLFLVSAGNLRSPDFEHLDRSDLEPVHDPAQAWNALTVGACTQKTVLEGKAYRGWAAVANAGDLSPWSTTSVTFAPTWPIKPDVVFEGGNAATNGDGEVLSCDPLSLLTTNWKPAEGHFTVATGTSPATAQGARLAARIAAGYSQLWPETVRALIVHSAEWTPAMKGHLRGAKDNKGKRARLVRRYGFGVPQLSRALNSAKDSLTLIAQATIRPFDDGGLNEMTVHALPWPKEVLEQLGEASVRMRVTLSYFIDPNPGRRGWRKKHSYQSHGLRFDVKGATESIDEFRKRLNQAALEGEEKKPDSGETAGWYLGPNARNVGSLHSDIWNGSAADLAERGVVAVFPVSGWWKEQPKRDRSADGVRYALVVSIETQGVEVDVDLWTPVAQQVGVQIET
ncbi:MAG: S8 family peptidase [Planctomycetota bacterium]